MKRIAVASGNPVKARATARAFRRMFPDEEFEVSAVPASSGVANQPTSEEETLRGARNRALGAGRAAPDTDFRVGLEGGVEETPDGLSSFARVVVVDRDGRVGRARTATFILPHPMAEAVRSGAELAHANRAVFDAGDLEHAGGAVGLLSLGALDRTELYEQAVLLALIPFLQPALYPKDADS